MAGAVETTPKEIQQALSARGFDVGTVDGKWGKRSERALQAFQSANGLTPSGSLDKATANKLFPERYGLRAQMALRAEERTDENLTPANADLLTVYRLARTGAGRCPVQRLDVSKIEGQLKGRFAGHFDEVAAIISDVGARETTGLLFLDQALPTKSCDEWAAAARSLGLMIVEPAVVPARPVPSQPSVPPPPPASQPSPLPPTPPDGGSVRSRQGEPPWSLSSGHVLIMALFAVGLAWRLRRRGPKAQPAAPVPLTPAAAAGPVRSGSTDETVRPGGHPSSLTERLAEHNRVVAEVIVARGRSHAPGDTTISSGTPALRPAVTSPVPKDADDVFGLGSAASGGAPFLAGRLAEHNRAVAEVIRARGPLDSGGLPPEPVYPIAPQPPAPPLKAAAGQGVWVAAGVPVTVAGLVVPGGMIWVGGWLRRRDDPLRNENCLIDPKLPVASVAAFAGQALPYWPSYADLHAASRRTYIDWLSGPRSDPGTNIGFVFLYFYGLERRLMLDGPGSERDVIRAEIERLLAVYGENASFRRYATDLLTAEAIRHSGLTVAPELDHDAEGFDVPLPLRIALGVRVRDGQPIEPDLLLAFVRSHPETRLRTPARRAAAELRDLFVREVEVAFPKGVRVGNAARIRKLKASYSAASGSFEVDLLPDGHGLPDITGLSEPLGAARRILDECTTRLDAYSRELGRCDGLRPTLIAVAKLPAAIRLERARALPGDPVAVLAALAGSGEHLTVQTFGAQLGLAGGEAIDKGRLREWSQIAGGLGFGLTCDPAFALRAAKADTPMTVFALAAPVDDAVGPGDGFRAAQVAVALAMVVALTDGEVQAAERQAVLMMIARAQGISDDERHRLVAEAAVQAVDPHALSDIKTRLKALPREIAECMASEIVAVASADGVAAPDEVAFLEKLFRQIGLDDRSLYSRLHGGVASADVMATVASAIPVTPQAVPSASPRASSGALDLDRLAAIRRETASLSSRLAGIFAEEEVAAPALPPVPEVDDSDDDGGLDGLDRRHRSLVEAIAERAEWSRGDFEHLVRGVGLMAGAAIETLNDWSLDRFDDILLEGDDPIVANRHLLPRELARADA